MPFYLTHNQKKAHTNVRTCAPPLYVTAKPLLTATRRRRNGEWRKNREWLTHARTHTHTPAELGSLLKFSSQGPVQQQKYMHGQTLQRHRVDSTAHTCMSLLRSAGERVTLNCTTTHTHTYTSTNTDTNFKEENRQKRRSARRAGKMRPVRRDRKQRYLCGCTTIEASVREMAVVFTFVPGMVDETFVRM